MPVLGGRMGEDRKVPELRFPGFEGGWSGTELGSASEPLAYGLKAPARGFDGENRYIRVSDIDNETRELARDGAASPDVDPLLAEGCRLAEGDILLTRAGGRKGKSYIHREAGGSFYHAGYLVRARMKDGFNPLFAFQETLTGRYAGFIAETSAASGRSILNARDLSRFEIMAPGREEQDKVASFLGGVDALISLRRRQCGALDAYKRGALRRLLPEGGAAAPELRFPGFAGQWERRKVSELGDVFLGLDTYKAGDGPLLIRGSNILDGRLHLGPEPIRADACLAAHNASRMHKAGDVVTARNTRPGASAVVGEKEAGSIGCLIIVTRPDTGKILPEYLCAVLNGGDHMRYASEPGHGRYTANNYSRYLVPLPCLEEQAKIAAFISELNGLIQIYRKEYEVLRQYKEGLLQKMLL